MKASSLTITTDGKAPAPSRRCVLVLGMHRSGTSVLSELLAALGCDLPATPMPPAADNPRGFFESFHIFKQHDALLQSAESIWYDYRPFPAQWFRTSTADEYRARLRSIVIEEFGNSSLFVVKDPRICRFVPFWTAILHGLQIQPFVVHTHRNPLEVAASLQKRNQFSLGYGCLLWLRHVLDAEFGSRGLRRIFTSYDQLMRNLDGEVDRISAGLHMQWPHLTPVDVPEFGSIVEPAMKTHTMKPEDVLYDGFWSGWVREVYKILQVWARDGENVEDHETLDDIRQSLAESAALTGSLVYPKGETTLVDLANAKAKAVNLDKALAETLKTVATLTAERDRAMAKSAQLSAELAKAVQEQKSSKAATEWMLGELATAKAGLTAAEARIEAITAALSGPQMD